jgi:drug/metabolite transporter (DMT)-like permease
MYFWRMKQELKNWLLLIFLATVWGSSFILMKRGMFDAVSGERIFSSNQVASLRMLIASSVLLPLGWKYLRSYTSWQLIAALATVAFLGNFIPAFLFTYAEIGISSGYTGMLNSATPVFTILIGILVYQQKWIPIQILGVIIGSMGIVWLVNAVRVVDTSGGIIHVMAVILATLFYAISVNTIKFHLAGHNAIKITVMAFMLSFVPSLLLFFYFDTPDLIVQHPKAPKALLYIAILAIVGTAFSVIVFNVLIANSTPLFASSVTYFIPIVAVIIGVLDGEEFSGYQLLAMLVILVGVFVANVLGRRNRANR